MHICSWHFSGGLGGLPGSARVRGVGILQPKVVDQPISSDVA